MIIYKNKVYEDYFIDKVSAVITDKDGKVQPITVHGGRPYWRGKSIHCIQAHTAWGWIPELEVHHIDENKMNNALSNLKYLTPEEHRRLHMLGKKYRLGKKYPHSEETKQKMSEAQKIAQSTPERRKQMSEAAKGNQNCLGYHWWNNGVEQIYAKECPGEGWVIGKLEENIYVFTEDARQKVGENSLGRIWWNNGEEERCAAECPGDGWVRGRLPR